jgi:hypothetical protein
VSSVRSEPRLYSEHERLIRPRLYRSAPPQWEKSAQPLSRHNQQQVPSQFRLLTQTVRLWTRSWKQSQRYFGRSWDSPMGLSQGKCPSQNCIKTHEVKWLPNFTGPWTLDKWLGGMPTSKTVNTVNMTHTADYTPKNERIVFSSERAPTSTKLQLSDSNKDLELCSRRGLTPRLTGRATVAVESTVSCKMTVSQ